MYQTPTPIFAIYPDPAPPRSMILTFEIEADVHGWTLSYDSGMCRPFRYVLSAADQRGRRAEVHFTIETTARRYAANHSRV